MSNIIDFLEWIGRDAGLRHAPNGKVEQALATMQIAPELRAAVLGSDTQQLAALLGAPSNVCCMVEPPLDPGEEEEEDGPEDDYDITAIGRVA